MPSSLANAYLPDRVSPPGETLQEVLADREMSQAELAERTGRPKKTINEIVQGKAGISPKTALQFERVLGIPASFWNNLERNYRDYLARKQEEELCQASTGWLRQIPVKSLVKLGWIQQYHHEVDQVRELLSFFGVASPEDWQVFAVRQASFRHPSAFTSDLGALAAWLRKGELEAQGIRCAPFDKAGFEVALAKARSLTVMSPEEFVPRLVASCAAAGVAVVFVPELPKCRAHGATRWISSNKALIQLSLRYKTADQLWFTFFHEAGHILLHSKRLTFIEGGEAGSSKETEEDEANRFAAEYLIPPQDLRQLAQLSQARRLSEEQIRSCAARIGVAPGIVVGQLQHLGWLPFSHLNGLKVRLQWAAIEPPDP